MHHLLVIPQHHVANILDSDVDTVKQLEKATFEFLKSDPEAQEHGPSSIILITFCIYKWCEKLTEKIIWTMD